MNVTVPAEHAELVESWAEEQTIMTCEPGYLPTGEFHIAPHSDDSTFWEFVEELLDILPFGVQVKISK